MRFIHTADIHLGANPDAGEKYTKLRGKELWEALERLIDVCADGKTDLLLIAGDLFHRQPLLRELREVNALFARIPETQIVLCAGNHDYLRRDSYYRTFRWADHVHMLLDAEVTGVELPSAGTAVYGFSYHERETDARPYEGKRAPGKQPVEILMVHGGDANHVPVDREELLRLGYDYIALGHIHKPQIVVPDRMAYCGALEPTDKNDLGEHGYIAGEITEKGCRIEFVPFAGRKYIHMTAPVTRGLTGYELREKIGQAIERKGIRNMYRVVLQGFRDADVQYDLQSLDTYGNITDIFDDTKPAYDYRKICEQNADNILGQLIRDFIDCDENSTEYRAMCEGVRALMETRRD